MKNIKVSEIQDIYNKKIQFEKKKEPKDFIGSIEYGIQKRAIEEKVIQLDNQLNNIEYEYGKLYRNIFIDRYIKNKNITNMTYKYNMHKSTLYEKLKKAREVFENKKVF